MRSTSHGASVNQRFRQDWSVVAANSRVIPLTVLCSATNRPVRYSAKWRREGSLGNRSPNWTSNSSTTCGMATIAGMKPSRCPQPICLNHTSLFSSAQICKSLVIPEISYRKAKNRVEGPDLTAIDIDREVLVAIESKAKRMRVVSRVHPGTNFLMEDLQGALAAFEKLPVKIQDLYAGLPEYSVYQSSIDRTKSKAPIAVVVLGEGVYFINELLNDYLKNDQDHFLNKYSEPYCLMRIEAFERAIEVAASNNLSLYDLLHKYWTGSKSTNITEASAETFAPYPITSPTLPQRYARKFHEEYIEAFAG